MPVFIRLGDIKNDVGGWEVIFNIVIMSIADNFGPNQRKSRRGLTTFPTRFRIGTFHSVLDIAFFSVPDAFSHVSRR